MKPTQIAINQVPNKQTTSQLLAEKMTCLLDNVRNRAYELFDRRGRVTDMILTIGSEPRTSSAFCQPQRSRRPNMRCGSASSVRGSALTSSKCTQSPRRLQWRGLRSKPTVPMIAQRNVTERTLYGRYQLPVEVNTGLVTATLGDGVLEIVAEKADAKAPPLEPQPQKDKSAAA